jgi:hypothetical protein
MEFMTSREIKLWNIDGYRKYLRIQYKFPVTINGVTFYDESILISFRYKNCRGLIHPTNGYIGEQEDKKNYYPLLKVSMSFSSEMKYNPTFSPSLDVASSEIKESWKLFTQGD